MTDYSRDELQNWLENPVTRDLLRALMEYQEELKSQWSQGVFESWDESQRKVGQVQGVQVIFDIIDQVKESYAEEVTND